MGRNMGGTAKDRIPFGAHVLCRNYEVSIADPSIANATADSAPLWKHGRDYYKPGDFLFVTPVEGLGERDLHAMAAGPIMEPVRIYLPAGKVSEAEYQARLALDFERAGIDRKTGRAR